MNVPHGPAAQPRLVSVLVRSMDRPTLTEALVSICRQSWPRIEVVVVNAKGPGHSDPGVQCGPFPLRFIDAGVPLDRSASANAALAAAEGEWLCFLDDDDWMAPDHIEHLVAACEADGGSIAAYSGVSCVKEEQGDGQGADGRGGLVEVMRYNFPFDAARLLCENYLPIHSVLFSREAARRTNGFDPELPIFEDWDFWIQLSRLGPFRHVDRVSAVYRLGSGDSGLYGNAALQSEMAARVLAKWLPAWGQDELAAIWRLARASLQAEARALAQMQGERRLHEAELGVVRQYGANLQAQLADSQRMLHDTKRALDDSEHAFAELRIASERTRVSLENSLQGAMREYEQAVTLLRREQYTVLRPIARNLKDWLRPVYQRLPQPLRKAARRILARPIQMATAAPMADPLTTEQWRDTFPGGEPGKETVIVFPVIDWHFRVQRPQHLARELARQGHRVIYLTTTFAQGSGPADCRLLDSPEPGVHILQLALPGTPPNIYEDTLGPRQAAALAGMLAWLQQEAGLGALISLVNLPFWRPVAAALPASTMVYDCMDYHAGFSTNTGRMLDEEHALLADCDLLLTTSLRLYELMQEKAPGKPHALVRNGTQVEHFAQVPAVLKIQPDGRPVIGYFGAISEWFDMPLVVAAARARPDWRFVLVGSTFGCDVTEAQKLANMEFVGEVPYAELPGWVHAFDVCTIPFVLNELTSCTNPVKVYEYLSAGKPVVATRMPELEAIAEQVRLADDAAGFVAQIEGALAEGGDAALARSRREWARQHGWESRALALSEAVAASRPSVSAIVLCYNNLALTQACLASVERHSHWAKLEVVAVDNASTDGTADWLREYASTRPWVKLVLNERNLGFAAGNNVGLAAATGDILVMLNNDTQVSPGWVHGLVRHLQHDPSLGMVGPVTNNIGNEAKVDAGYTDPADMPAWAAARAVEHAGRQFRSRVLAFFCVAMRREVYEKVGGLDEAFGIGFFEDDDYCNRVREAGWQLAIADDVFVHHHLSASFDQMKAASRQALFEKNKAIYEKKWGPWIPHQYRPESLRKETQE